MKNKFLKKLYPAVILLAVVTAFSACKKDDIDESGSANVKVVNASPNSSAQGFYLASKTVVQGGLDFGDNSDGYISVNSGNNLQLEFRNEGSSTAYATGEYDLDKGRYYTVFLAGSGQTARVKAYADDLTVPSSGKAKIRFVHLADAAPANVDIKTSGGTTLAANLAKDNASNYLEVDPGVLSLEVFAAGQTTSLANFDLSAFAQGKIYTVYITGSTAESIAVKQVSHN